MCPTSDCPSRREEIKIAAGHRWPTTRAENTQTLLGPRRVSFAARSRRDGRETDTREGRDKAHSPLDLSTFRLCDPIATTTDGTRADRPPARLPHFPHLALPLSVAKAERE